MLLVMLLKLSETDLVGASHFHCILQRLTCLAVVNYLLRIHDCFLLFSEEGHFIDVDS